MNYSQEIGQTLAETLTELFVIDEMGIPLNEIRDLATLKGHLDSAAEKYGVKHPKYKALQNLHAKKEAAENRKTERMTRVKTRQEFHAKRYGYKPVKGSKRNEWVHGETGHKLSFGDGRSWSHMKSGGKRAKGGNATPIRDLRRHLAKLHEDATPPIGEPLDEIRHFNVLNNLASKALLAKDPAERQNLQRLLALQRRKRGLMGGGGRMAEDEEQDRSEHREKLRQDYLKKMEPKRKAEADRSAAADAWTRKNVAAGADAVKKKADEKKASLEKSKSECSTCKRGGAGPSHEGSSMCRSGSIASGGHRAHCSCDTCF
jgi:hypothetical protein